MFDAIEDIPTGKLIAELEDRGYKVTNRLEDRSHLLKDHVVLFIMPDAPLALEGFLCSAEDSEHAEEQAEDAYPGCDVVWIQEGTDWQDAQANYWAGYVTRGHR
jgi:hypothetical protein